MFKALVTILFTLNPLVGLFITGANAPQDASLSGAPLFNVEQNYKLPVINEASIFLAARQLPLMPWRNWNVADPQIEATTSLVYDTFHRQVLWQKNDIYQARSIASLTKLMTALVVMEQAKLDTNFKISEQAVATPGETGNLRVGEEMSVKNLLTAALVSSSNDAAAALATNVSLEFVYLMNKKAQALGLKNTSFFDPSGLNPNNRSSAWDLIKIMQEALKHPELQQIMQTATIDVRSADGKFNHHLENTNKLLGQVPDIVGGKTGYTAEAGNCMILAVKSPHQGEYNILVVMDAQDRLAASATLAKWTREAFLW
ncbi:MAG TPA: hypothetical protein DHI91_01920 [Candidatus Portnoybacteria bacterium]|uniref:Peptidase S11 D-alanyl-D-alanine carboxypeptidase A N-terminal domain-containing protein n=1 Tax=Candidatus Portnoybacteria bacterium CG02_land_8_20_14_3_00_45_8 TaxID=1974807 RepID=A0A2M7D6Y7_9BACT|nr:MAG: hypothetical protein COS30_00170 [Candidatus Portnoybacteria bacterium CG02_land_8_20_14_3_00_45_8]HCX27876.1 hypothetical protein [Candidatus Portnoybacteria bacterium]